MLWPKMLVLAGCPSRQINILLEKPWSVTIFSLGPRENKSTCEALFPIPSRPWGVRQTASASAKLQVPSDWVGAWVPFRRTAPGWLCGTYDELGVASNKKSFYVSVLLYIRNPLKLELSPTRTYHQLFVYLKDHTQSEVPLVLLFTLTLILYHQSSDWYHLIPFVSFRFHWYKSYPIQTMLIPFRVCFNDKSNFGLDIL